MEANTQEFKKGIEKVHWYKTSFCNAYDFR